MKWNLLLTMQVPNKLTLDVNIYNNINTMVRNLQAIYYKFTLHFVHC